MVWLLNGFSFFLYSPLPSPLISLLLLPFSHILFPLSHTYSAFVLRHSQSHQGPTTRMIDRLHSELSPLSAASPYLSNTFERRLAVLKSLVAAYSGTCLMCVAM